MARKKEKILKKLPKLPKLAWWGLWFVGIVASLFIILYSGAQIWVSTWQTYKNDELGFSFRYPKTWNIVNKNNIPITKAQIEKYGWAGFNVDLKAELPNDPQDPITSPGDVSIYIEKISPGKTTFEVRKEQGFFSKYKTDVFGAKIGYFNEDIGMTTENTHILSKELFVNTDKYAFRIYTLTYSDDSSFLSGLKAKLYHLIGKKVLDSFIFTK